MTKTTLMLTTVFVLILSAGSVSGQELKFQDHSFPFDFLFGNHIDTHQESMVTNGEKLIGFFYIRFTGEQTAEGVAVATHANCAQVSEQCTVGWMLHGVPVRATLVDHQPGQHPTWFVDPADLPRQRGYSHFHWLGPPDHAHAIAVGETYDGWLLKLTAVKTFFFQHHGGFLVTPGIDAETHANIVSDLP